MGPEPGIEDYDELRQQMERARKLDPRRREIILDRIEELEFQKKTKIPSLETLYSTLIGMIAVFIAVLSIAIQQKHVRSMVSAAIMLFVLGAAVMVGPVFIKKAQRPYDEKIQKNYDILQGKRI